MATYTKNYNIKKPDSSEFYNIADFNNAMDKIDENMIAMQGFVAKTTVFNEDGSIVETNGLGQTKTTTFNANNSITEVFAGDKTITKTTTFNMDGTVSEVIS